MRLTVWPATLSPTAPATGSPPTIIIRFSSRILFGATTSKDVQGDKTGHHRTVDGPP
jgi:hypothetical protein